MAGICQTLALVLHFFLLSELEDVCTSSQTENSRAHITASIVLNAIGLVLCGAWVTIRNEQKKDDLLAAWLASKLAVWTIKIAWIATTALSFLFAASLYGLTIGLRDTCSSDFDGRGLSLTALLLFTAGLAAGHLGAKKHKYEKLDLRPGPLERDTADKGVPPIDLEPNSFSGYSVKDNLRF